MKRNHTIKVVLFMLVVCISLLACQEEGEVSSEADNGIADVMGDLAGGDVVDNDRSDAGEDALLDSGDMGVDPFSVCAPGFGENAPVRGQQVGYEVAGQSRSFYLQLPESLDTLGPLPVIFSFHGTNGTGLSGYTSYELGLFVEAGYVVIAPDGNENGEIWPVWDAMRTLGNESLDNPDLALFDSLIACISAHYPIDDERIFVVGMSAGGIMVNHVLQRRSELLAGGVVASGIFDLTSPDPMPELGSMAVMVTWGGDNDAWGGEESDSGTVLTEFNFVEQAAVASQFWEGAEGINQIHCVGDDLGHAWLGDIIPVMSDFFLSHPKGSASTSEWEIPQLDAGWPVTCSEEAAEYVSPVEVICEETEPTSCQSTCQLMGDCVVENATVAPVLGPQLVTMGFDGEQCGGCLDLCEGDFLEGGAVDEAVYSCFEEEYLTISCGVGIVGGFPYIDAVNNCCDGQLESVYCTRLCQGLNENDVARDFFPSCLAWSE
jgi:poly(3-hydroxybutyrate) depolymerase